MKNQSFKWKVLITAPYLQPFLEEYRDSIESEGIEILAPPVKERFEEGELLKWIADIDGVICGDDRFTRKVFQQAEKLKVVSKWGTGIDSIDKIAAKEFNVVICNTPNAFSVPVADSVLGFILSFSRNISIQDHDMKNGKWEKIPGISLQECTLGVIGVGNVGKQVIKRANVFGMRILVNDIKEIPESYIQETKVKSTCLKDLLIESDFVSVNCDLNPTSFHLINKETLSLMKPNSVIINTARGPIMDENALVETLISGAIKGAGMDVFEDEPLPDTSKLRSLNNVLMSPHNSNSSPMAWKKVHENTISNLIRELKARS